MKHHYRQPDNLKIQTQFGNTMMYKDLKSLDLRSGRGYAMNFIR